MEVLVKNLKQTQKFAKKFAKGLNGGERILLNGDLAKIIYATMDIIIQLIILTILYSNPSSANMCIM